MAPYEKTFKRKEAKYLLEPSEARHFLSLANAQLEADEIPESLVFSTYLDTEDYQLINRSREKPVYKAKLRIRTYGEPVANGPAFVELKKKYDGVEYKRRVSMSYAAACAWMNGVPFAEADARFPLAQSHQIPEESTWMRQQIAREIDGYRKVHETLSPSLELACKRFYFHQGKGALLVTFDFSIQARDLRASHAGFQPLLDNGYALMELKSSKRLPSWLTDELSSCKIYPTPFNKYDRAFKTLVNPTVERRCHA